MDTKLYEYLSWPPESCYVKGFKREGGGEEGKGEGLFAKVEVLIGNKLERDFDWCRMKLKLRGKGQERIYPLQLSKCTVLLMA